MGLDINTIEILEHELAKNTEILEITASKFNIKILNIAYNASCHDGTIDVYIEFMTLDGKAIKKAENSIGLDFKINFYKESKLLYSASCYFDNDHIDNFSGYDTIYISSDYTNLIEQATSARVFVVTA